MVIVQKITHKPFVSLKMILVCVVVSTGSLIFLAGQKTAWGAEPVCSRGDILLCEDWETGRDGWDWDTTWGEQPQCGAALQNTGTTAFQGNCALQLGLAKDGEGTIYPYHTIPPQTGTTYARFYVKFSQNYQWNPSGQKVFYLISISKGAWSWFAQIGATPEDSGNLTGPGRLYIDPTSRNPRYYPNRGTAADWKISQGQWYGVEMMVTPNTAAGTANGAVKMWINGVLVMEHVGVDWRLGSSDPASPAINAAWITGYYGGPVIPHPAQNTWHDNLVVSKSYIGLGVSGDISPPAPPKNLRIQ